MQYSYGQILNDGANTPLDVSTNAIALDSATDQFRSLFTMPETATITAIGFHYYDKTGTPARYRISLRSLGTTNKYGDDTILGATNSGYGHFTPDGGWTNNTYHEITLTESVTISEGTTVVVCIDSDIAEGETIDGSNYIRVIRNCRNVYPVRHSRVLASQPVWWNNLTGSWATDVAHPSILLASATKHYGGFIGFTYPNSIANGVSSGNITTLPGGSELTYTIGGVSYFDRCTGSATDTFRVEYYIGGGASDTTVSHYEDVYPRFTSYYDGHTAHSLSLSTPITVAGGQPFRLVIKRTTANTSVFGQYITIPPEQLSALPLGTAQFYTSRSTSNWTDNTSAIGLVYPIITNIAGASSSTLLQPSFNPGFN